MSEPPRQTRTYLMSLFEQHGANPRHDLGQNFLIDLNLHDYIVNAAEVSPEDVVLEVGTGTGALTSAISCDAGRVITVEYDRRVHEIAKELLQSRSNVTLLNCDVLKNKNRFNPDVLEAVTSALDASPSDRPKSLKLVANLPYNVATPVMSNLVATDLPWTRMVVTIQYELAERMAAAPGSSQYSALSVWLQAQTKVTLLKKLGPNVFWPRPQVDSAIVRIDPDPIARAAIADREFLHVFVRDVFTQRRKRLRGVVASMFKATHDKATVDAAFEQAGISIEARAEELPPDQLVRLANSLGRKAESVMNQTPDHGSQQIAMPALFDIDELRARFPALSRKHNGVVAAYFDGAAGSQVPQLVIDAIADCLAHHNAKRGSVIPTSREADERIEAAHQSLADFLGAASPAEIVFGQNMTSLTFAMSRALARTWNPGDEIIVTRLDHDANVTPWTLAARDAGATVHTIEFDPADCTLDVASLFDRLSSRTRLVAVGYASNAVGTINPVADICRAARSIGALSFVDAVHFAPHGRINAEQLGCDFLACSPYKFFGPHLGVLYGRLEHLERIEAYKLRPAPAHPPGKWMTGTQSHEAICGATAAVDYIASLSGGAGGSLREKLDLAFGMIRQSEQILGDRLLAGLRELQHFKLWGISDSSRWAERVPTFSITHASLTPQQLSERLLANGLFTWAGNHYALSFCQATGLEPNGTLRLSLMHYNTVEEIDRLVDALRRIDRT